jgi:hypothetical protein
MGAFSYAEFRNGLQIWGQQLPSTLFANIFSHISLLFETV